MVMETGMASMMKGAEGDDGDGDGDDDGDDDRDDES